MKQTELRLPWREEGHAIYDNGGWSVAECHGIPYEQKDRARFTVKACNMYYELVGALRAARVEISLLNLTQEGSQRENTPAVRVIDRIDTPLKRAERE